MPYRQPAYVTGGLPSRFSLRRIDWNLQIGWVVKMISKKLLSKMDVVTLLLGVSFSIAANATTLTFDDVSPSTYAHIDNGYGGLDWDNFNVEIPYYDSGYRHGLVSGSYVAYNGSGTQATVSGSAFNFEGVYLTGAWNNGLNVTVSGFLDGNMLYSKTVTVNSYQPTWFAFNYTGIDKLTFDSFGGVDAGYIVGGGTNFAMDDFAFSPVPVPAAVWLFGSGLLGVAGLRRTRKPAWRVFSPISRR